LLLLLHDNKEEHEESKAEARTHTCLRSVAADVSSRMYPLAVISLYRIYRYVDPFRIDGTSYMRDARIATPETLQQVRALCSLVYVCVRVRALRERVYNFMSADLNLLNEGFHVGNQDDFNAKHRERPRGS